MNSISRFSRLPIVLLSFAILAGASAPRPAFCANAAKKSQPGDSCASMTDAKKKAECEKKQPAAKSQGKAKTAPRRVVKISGRPGAAAFSSVPAVTSAEQVCKHSDPRCVSGARVQAVKRTDVVKKDPSLQSLLSKDILDQLRSKTITDPEPKPIVVKAEGVAVGAVAKTAAKVPPPAQPESAQAPQKGLLDGVLDFLNSAVIAPIKERLLPPQADPNKPDFGAVACKLLIYGCNKPNAKYGKVNGELFVNGPSSSDIEQGRIGDCYLMSSLAAIAQQNPKVIEQAVKDNGNGTYSVTLYKKQWWDPLGVFGLKPQTVTVDNQFPLDKDGNPVMAGYGLQNSKNGQKEMWPMVIEKALAQSSLNGSYNAIGSGDLASAMEALTGKRSQAPPPASVTIDQLAQWKAKGEGVTMMTYLLDQPSNPDYGNGTGGKLEHAHVYYLKSVDAKNGTVTLGNPWGYGDATLTQAQLQQDLALVYVNPIN